MSEPTPADVPEVTGRPAQSLSPSRAADFKACPLRYRFRVVDRLPEPPSAAAVRGTLVHSVLERLFDLPAGQRTVERAISLLPAQWAQLRAEEPRAAELFGPADADADADATSGEAVAGAAVADGAVADAQASLGDSAPREGTGPPVLDEQAWLASAEPLLAGYFALEDPRRLQPASREEYVEATLPDGLVLRGVIDRLDATAEGALRVVDYKTGRSPAEAWEGKALFQLKFYALVLWRTRGVIPAVLQLLYLADRQRLSYTPAEAELVAFERQLTALWQAIQTALETGDFRANKGPLCAFCDHQARCPAFGGTPPPYPVADPPVVLLPLAPVNGAPSIP
ncbi:MAG TPA: PD-(D/E)XK nuclease family protein [Mycobacteriales bacterium]|nr:PD-(D/E)XK nuclease family protein [Mycobacteriales bacterium]